MVVMLKPVSAACNMACGYCFYAREAAQRRLPCRPPMSTQLLQTVLRRVFAVCDGRADLIFQGGEPTLAGLDFYRRAVRIEREYPQIRCSNSLQTNGLLIDENWAAFLAESGFTVGLSLDGDALTNGLFRRAADGSDPFARVPAAARLLQKNRVPFSILTVVTDALAPHVESLYRFYADNGLTRLQFIPCIPPDPQEPLLTPAAYGEFLCRLFDLWLADAQKDREPFVAGFDDLAALLCGRPAQVCGRSGVCAAQVVVESDASVYPCDFYCLDEWRLGSLADGGFAALDLSLARRFIADSAPVPTACRGCEFLAVCRNGCRRLRGSDGVSVFCQAYQTFLRHALPQMHKLLKKRRILV